MPVRERWAWDFLCRTRTWWYNFAAKYGIPQVFTDYEEMFALPGLDAVIIATPDDLHYPMTLAALIDGIGLGDALASSIESLRRRKAETNELGRGGRLDAIDAFVAEQLIWAQEEIIRLGGEVNRPSDEEADQLFRTLLSWT